MKKPLILSFAMFAAIALADGILAGSYGKGSAVTTDGRIASFDYSETKRTASNGSQKFEGKLRFEQRQNDHGRYVLIEMSAADALGVSGNVCEFGGRGRLTILVNKKPASFGGRAYVRAVDRRNLEHPNLDADQFRIRFIGEKDLTFDFEGLVREGDLKVGTQTVK